MALTFFEGGDAFAQLVELRVVHHRHGFAQHQHPAVRHHYGLCIKLGFAAVTRREADRSPALTWCVKNVAQNRGVEAVMIEKTREVVVELVRPAVIDQRQRQRELHEDFPCFRSKQALDIDFWHR